MDKGQKATEARLKEIERRINKEYKQAIDEIEDELTDYLQRFEKKDETWRKWVENGTKTEEEYEKWRIGQMAVGKRWSDQKEMLAHQLYETNERAKKYIKSVCPEVYAENFNFSTYDIEKQAHIDTGFTLYSKESVERLIEEDPEVLPPVGKKVSQQIAEGKAVRWNKQQLQSVMIQGILQGDSIPKLATRLANKVGDSNRKAAIRNARTMTTGAQNAGRVAAYKRAKDRGANIEQMWMATLDNRTRHSHRWLDREVRPVGEPFSNGCEFPADPKGPAAEIYNCRCTLRAIVKGLEPRSGQYRDNSAIDGMSYEEWKKGHSQSNPIDLPEKKAQNIKNSFINEYRYGPRSNGIMGSEDSDTISMINQRNTGKGNPNAIRLFDVDLNNRQKKLLEQLPATDSTAIVPKSDVNMKDLSAMTAYTGDEFALFTKGQERMIMRGHQRGVNLNTEDAEKLAEQGYKWTGHTHPATGKGSTQASTGDYRVLKAFNQKQSAIYNAQGQYEIFHED